MVALLNLFRIKASGLVPLSPLEHDYTPSPAKAEFDGLTAGVGTIQLYP